MFVCLFTYWLIYSSPNLFFFLKAHFSVERGPHLPFSGFRVRSLLSPTAAGLSRCSRCSGSSAPLLSEHSVGASTGWGWGAARLGVSRLPGPQPLPRRPPGSRRRHRGNPGGTKRDLRCEEPAGPMGVKKPRIPGARVPGAGEAPALPVRAPEALRPGQAAAAPAARTAPAERSR